jgi:hypothetical protein
VAFDAAASWVLNVLPKGVQYAKLSQDVSIEVARVRGLRHAEISAVHVKSPNLPIYVEIITYY